MTGLQVETLRTLAGFYKKVDCYCFGEYGRYTHCENDCRTDKKCSLCKKVTGILRKNGTK